MRLTRRQGAWLAAAAAAALAIGCGVWMALAPPRVDMARYAPEGALLFVEVDSLPDVSRGLTGTDASQARPH